MTLSAIVSASVWRRSISCWLGASSWKLYSTGMLIVSSVRIVCLRSVPATSFVVEVEEAALVERHAAPGPARAARSRRTRCPGAT